MALREQIKDAMKSDERAVGLANNSDIRFQCGTCEYCYDGFCQNEHHKLKGEKVEAKWCCNLYDHKGMKVVIA